MEYKKWLKWGAVLLVVSILLMLYKNYNPLESAYFPKCPFLQLTHYKCPGCGSQRAIHHLLNFDVVSAAKENLLLVLSIPYLLVGFIFDITNSFNGKALKWRNILMGQTAIMVVLFVVVGFWVIRNLI